MLNVLNIYRAFCGLITKVLGGGRRVRERTVIRSDSSTTRGVGISLGPRGDSVKRGAAVKVGMPMSVTTNVGLGKWTLHGDFIIGPVGVEVNSV